MGRPKGSMNKPKMTVSQSAAVDRTHTTGLPVSDQLHLSKKLEERRAKLDAKRKGQPVQPDIISYTPPKEPDSLVNSNVLIEQLER